MSILIGLLLALGCAVTTNVASVLKHRGANLAPSFRISRPLRSTRALLRSRWFAAGLGLAPAAGLRVARLVAHRGVLLSIAVGFIVFGDPMAHGTLAWIGQSAAFALVLFGSALMPSSSREKRAGAPGAVALSVA